MRPVFLAVVGGIWYNVEIGSTQCRDPAQELAQHKKEQTMNVNRRRRKRSRGLLIFMATVAFLAGFFYTQQTWLTTREVAVVLDGLPQGFDGLRIAQISDLHGMEFGTDNSRLLEQVADFAPDLIAVTGDLIDEEDTMELVPHLAAALADIAPTYYVTGNHEWARGEVSELIAALESAGVVCLQNQSVILERSGDRLALCGVHDPNGYADQKTPEELMTELTGAKGELFTLLLAHRNTLFPRYAAAGYDFVLSGHGHGGLIRLPFTDGLVGTNMDLFPTYTNGEYTSGDSTLFVSRGLGNNPKMFRLFNRPDLPLITLRAA